MHSRLGSPNILSTLSSGWLAVYFIGCAALAMLRWQSTIFTEAYNRLTGLLNTPSAEPFLYYDPLLMVSILLVAPLFYFAFRARISNSLLILFTKRTEQLLVRVQLKTRQFFFILSII